MSRFFHSVSDGCFPFQLNPLELLFWQLISRALMGKSRGHAFNLPHVRRKVEKGVKTPVDPFSSAGVQRSPDDNDGERRRKSEVTAGAGCSKPIFFISLLSSESFFSQKEPLKAKASSDISEEAAPDLAPAGTGAEVLSRMRRRLTTRGNGAGGGKRRTSFEKKRERSAVILLTIVLLFLCCHAYRYVRTYSYSYCFTRIRFF